MSIREVHSLVTAISLARLFYFTSKDYHDKLDLFLTLGIDVTATILDRLALDYNCP